MDKALMCRICLVKGVRMRSLDNIIYLQETYEQLTAMPFNIHDGRPLQVCYICCARLQNCFRLRVTCLQSEEFFTQILENNNLQPKLSQDLNTLKIVQSVVNLCCVPGASIKPDNGAIIGDVKIDTDQNSDDDYNMDPLENSLDFKVKLEYDDEEDNIDLGISNYTAPEDMVKSANNMLIYDVPIIEAGDNIYETAVPSIEDNINLKTAKITLNKIDMDCIKPSAVNSERQKLALVKENDQTFNTSNKPETEVIYDQTKNVTYKIQTRKKHTKEKTSAKLFKCDTCEKCYRSKFQLVLHIRAHTGSKPYKCNICGKGFKDKYHLVRHTRIHTDRLYKCDTCEKSFKENSSLTDHIHTHTVEKPFKCDICGKCFKRKPYLRIHIIRHSERKLYQCAVCGKCLSTKYHLNQHNDLHNVERPYKCDICDKSYKQKACLRGHTHVHTKKPYQCNICGKCFSNKGHLNLHVVLHTLHAPYKCDICEKCFSRKGVLKKHIYMHTGETPFKCDICEKGFRDRSHLILHIRTHTGERPYKCDLCEKSFKENSALVKHIRTHTGEKPFKCDICGKCFSQKNSLTTHTRNVHK